MLVEQRLKVATPIALMWVLSWLSVGYHAQPTSLSPGKAEKKFSPPEKIQVKVSRGERPGIVVFSEDGQHFAGRDQGSIVVWNASSGKEAARLDANQFSGYLAFVPRHQHVMSLFRSQLKRFDFTSKELVSTLNLEQFEDFIGFLSDGQHFVSYSQGKIQIRDAKKGEVLRDFPILDRFLLGSGMLILSQDRRLLANVHTSKRLIKIWDVESGKELSTLNGHSKLIQGVCFCPANKWVASTGWDKTVKIWNAKTGECIQDILLPESGLQVAFSPDGKWLAVGSVGNKSRVSILDTANWQQLALWETKVNCSRNLAFHPQGHLLATAGSEYIQVWELPVEKKLPIKLNPFQQQKQPDDEKKRASLPQTAGLSAEFSTSDHRQQREPKFLGFISDSLVIQVRRGEKPGEERISAFDLKGRKEAWSVVRKGSSLYSHAMSPDGRLLVAGDQDGVRGLDTSSGKGLLAENAPDRVSRIIFSAAGQEFVSLSPLSIQYWKFDDKKNTIEKGKLISNEDKKSFDGHLLSRAAMSPDLQRCATQNNMTGEFCVWDLSTRNKVCTLKGVKKLIYKVMYTPNGKWIIGVEHKTPIGIWDAENGDELRRIDAIGDLLTPMAVSRNSKWLAVGGGTIPRGEVTLWDLATGKKLLSLAIHRDTKFAKFKDHTVRAVAFNQTATTLAAATEGSLYVWELKESPPDKK